MRRSLFAAASLALLLAAVRVLPAAGLQAAKPAAALRVVELSGTPYEMGLAHGRALKSEIAGLVKRWKGVLARTYKMQAEEFLRKFLAATDFKPAIERWTPGLLDEVRGIADGAGLDFDTVFAFQMINEVSVLGRDAAGVQCTSIAAGPRPGFPAFTSQTMDLQPFYLGYPTVLRVMGDAGSPEALVLTVPGVIALNGLNDRALGVCVNAVTQLASSAKGLPVAFLVRGLLRRANFEDAEAFLREVTPAAPQTYLIAGPAEAACFERSAGRMERFLPFPGAAFTFHTNHPLVNKDLAPRFARAAGETGLPVAPTGTSLARLAHVCKVLVDGAAVLDLAALKALYADRPSGINNAGTYACVIMTLDDSPALHIAPGRPDVVPFQRLDFSASTPITKR